MATGHEGLKEINADQVLGARPCTSWADSCFMSAPASVGTSHPRIDAAKDDPCPACHQAWFMFKGVNWNFEAVLQLDWFASGCCWSQQEEDYLAMLSQAWCREPRVISSTIIIGSYLSSSKALISWFVARILAGSQVDSYNSYTNCSSDLLYFLST